MNINVRRAIPKRRIQRDDLRHSAQVHFLWHQRASFDNAERAGKDHEFIANPKVQWPERALVADER